MYSEKDVNEILGFGQVIDVLIGIDKETNEQVIKKYHFSPVSLKDMPKLMKDLNEFFNLMEGNNWNEDVINKCANVIKLSLNKMHPDISIDEIKQNFTLGGLAKGVSIVMDINDFLSQMQAMTQKMGKIAQTQA